MPMPPRRRRWCFRCGECGSTVMFAVDSDCLRIPPPTHCSKCGAAAMSLDPEPDLMPSVKDLFHSMLAAIKQARHKH